VAVRPADGRSLGVRSDHRGRPPVSRTPVSRTPGRPGPLVARRDLGGPRAYGTADRGRPEREPRGRARRFLYRYGWRAYAVPLLTVATLVTLGDLAANGGDRSTTTTAATTAATTVPTEAPVAADEGDSADGLAGVDDAPSQTPAPAGTYVQKGAGTVSVVDVASRVYGTGPLRRFAVEIEDGIGIDGALFARAVRSTLADPRSWGSAGQLSFQQVDAAAVAAGRYEFKVALVSPGNMDRYCPGLRTNGYTSCRVGERAVINLARWETAVPHYDGDLATYRHYVVNHEVGHALGHGHEACPAAGAVAPVMQQQTLGLDGCVRNAWPYP
jgi:hypothetical protein